MLKAKQKLGKYVIERKVGEGGFAAVYQARDTLEGVRVALKVPFANLVTKETIEDFRHEIQLAARLEHPNILPLKNAEFIDGHLVIASALGQSTLEKRLERRLPLATAIDYAEQMIRAVAYAHDKHIIHCDIKPENFLLFPKDRLRLTDFGIARVSQKTLHASGAGTVGYIAPEQALGRPSQASDVFSLGLVLYEMFSGHLPAWPFEWPPPGYDRLRRRLHPDLIEVLRRALAVDTRKRYRNAGQMLAAFQRVKSRSLNYDKSRSRGKKKDTKDWEALRRKEFVRHMGKTLETRFTCNKCDGPVSEFMQACPWCGKSRKVHTDETVFPIYCPRCHRGMKLDWNYCAWCYGAGFEPSSQREYSDARYVARCNNPRCKRKSLMPFMRYCPWCRRKVTKKWTVAGLPDKCSHCGCGTANAYWHYCPWCCKRLHK